MYHRQSTRKKTQKKTTDKQKHKISKKNSKMHMRRMKEIWMTKWKPRGRLHRLQMRSSNKMCRLVNKVSQALNVSDSLDSEKEVQLSSSMELAIVHSAPSLDGWQNFQKEKGKKDKSSVFDKV